MIDKFVFIAMIAVALFIVISRSYKRVIVAMGVFSLLASFCYLLYHAPDVALAEAIIGSALSTILYIVALKKHRSFYIYLTSNELKKSSDLRLRRHMQDVIVKIMEYCQLQELEAQTVFTSQSPHEIANEHVYDLILQKQESGKVKIYGLKTEKHVQMIQALLLEGESAQKVEFEIQQEGEEE